MRELSFYRRFADDVLAGRKTITIRDDRDADVRPGQVLRVSCNEDGRYLCHLMVTAVSPIHVDDLDDSHATQENLTLDELRAVIRDIYPDQSRLNVLEFVRVQPPSPNGSPE